MDSRALQAKTGAGWERGLVLAGFAGVALVPLTRAWRLSTDLAHGWIVPLLMAYLWWERWNERPPVGGRESRGGWFWWLAGPLALALVALRLFLTPFPQWPALVAAYLGGLVALGLGFAWLIAGKAGVRWFAPPLLLVLSAIPWPGMVDRLVIQPLRSGIATIAAEVVNAALQPALARGTSLQIGGHWVGVDEACGGIRSLQACVMIALFLGLWFRFAWRRMLVVVAGGVGAALAGNFLRVLFLASRAGHGDAAVAAAHDAAGWVAMSVSIVGTVLLACQLAGYRWPATGAAKRQSTEVVPRALWRKLGWVLLILVAGEVGTRWWYARGRASRGDIPQWGVRFPEKAPGYKVEPLTEFARELLAPDYFVSAHWEMPAGHSAAAYYVEWTKGQVARAVPFLHNPTVCLPLAGCDLVEEMGQLKFVWEGGVLPFSVYKFRRVSEEMAVAFIVWDPSRGRPLVRQDDTQREVWLKRQWGDVREGRAEQPAQLFTVAIDWDEQAMARLQALLSQMVFSRSTGNVLNRENLK